MSCLLYKQVKTQISQGNVLVTFLHICTSNWGWPLGYIYIYLKIKYKYFVHHTMIFMT